MLIPLAGALISQLFMPDVREKTVFTSLLLVQSALAWGIQSFGIGSAALFFISSLPLCLALLFNSVISSGPDVSLLSYAIGQFIPLTTGAQLAFEVLNVFVPLVSLAWPSISVHIADSNFDRPDARVQRLLLSTSSPLSSLF